MAKVALDYKPGADRGRAANHARWFTLGVVAPLIGAGLIYTISQRSPVESAVDSEPSSSPRLPPAEQILIEEIALESIPKPLGDTVEFVVRRNDTLERIFRSLKLRLEDLAMIRSVPGVRERLDRLAPGDTITLIHDEGFIHSLQRRISETEVLRVTRGGVGFEAEVVETPVEIRETTASGQINSSLFVSARAAGVSPEIILQLANEIFGWKIDFALDIQRGDRFTLIYEQKFRDGEYIGDGRIVAAEFINNGVAHRAVYYRSNDEKIADYFAPDGRSMRRQFLRAPLDFTRISSNFNPRRRHPILNTIRAHRGVDYAAPSGTVIKAAGEGRVSFVGSKGGYGRVVILEHGGGISTLYAHMSRFARGLRNGMRVGQGATIGFVGSSGAATGPHLHYEYRVNGVHKNPRTVPLPDAAPIAPSYMGDFQSRSGALLARLDRTRDTAVVAAPSE